MASLDFRDILSLMFVFNIVIEVGSSTVELFDNLAHIEKILSGRAMHPNVNRHRIVTQKHPDHRCDGRTAQQQQRGGKISQHNEKGDAGPEEDQHPADDPEFRPDSKRTVHDGMDDALEAVRRFGLVKSRIHIIRPWVSPLITRMRQIFAGFLD